MGPDWFRCDRKPRLGGVFLCLLIADNAEMTTDILPLTQTVSRRATAAMMAAMALAGMVGLVAWGPVDLVPHMHVFADTGAWLGVPNGVAVLTHLPLVPLGIWGLWRVWRLPAGEPLRWIWGWFFVCQMLATLGGMWYHTSRVTRLSSGISFPSRPLAHCSHLPFWLSASTRGLVLPRPSAWRLGAPCSGASGGSTPFMSAAQGI